MRLKIIEGGDKRAIRRLLAPAARADKAFDKRVAAIVDAVRDRGDRALEQFARRFDNVSPPLEVSPADIRAGADRVSADVRRAIAKAYVDIRVLDLNSVRQLSNRVAGHAPGSDGPVAKLLWAIGAQSLGHAWLDALGPLALTGADDGHAVSEYFYSRPSSVYGGSAQIQRNLLAQRFLGMPRT